MHEALVFHRNGQLDEAARIYDGMLAADPDDFDALHLSGLLKQQQGQLLEALRLVAAALRRRPDAAHALMDHGVILDALGRHEEALAFFDRLLATRAEDATLHYNRANTLKAIGRSADALASYERALALAPDLAAAHHNRGSTYAVLRRNEEALASYDRVLALVFERAGIMTADEISLADLAGSAQTLAAIDRALAAAAVPSSADVLNNRGKVLLRLKRHREALATFDRSLAVCPSQADALCHRGQALAGLDRHGEALADFAQALRIAPDCADAHLKRGNVLVELNRFAEALQSYLAALAIRPDHADAKFNEALARLCLGDFREGWRKYEHRWEREEYAKERPDYPRPRWRGADDVAGKTILLVTEQGLGDAIQFVRYAPLLAAKGANVLLGVRPPLAALMQSVPGVSYVISSGEALPAFDFYCPLLSLPLAFGTELATIPSTVPYIRADRARVERWRERLPPSGRLRVGLCWAGTAAHPNDHRRSIPLERLVAILALPGLDFVTLQKEVSEADAAILRERRVAQLGRDCVDFADTAAVMHMLDLVISVDTSVAHLAGAMAKATAVLIPFSPDFRWMLERTDTPWYPTMRLFRQPAIGDWGTPLERIRSELAALAARRVASSIEAAATPR